MRYLTLDLLAQLHHPFYGDAEHSLRLKLTETNARLQLRRAIEYRKTKLLIVDEAHPSLGGRFFSGQQRGSAQEACELVMADGVRIPLEVGVHGFVEVARGPRAALIGEIAAATRC